MNTRGLLDQLLKTGMGALGDAKAQVGRAHQSGDLAKYGTGAAVGGVLGLLLGSKGGRRMGGKALKVGGVVAIGALAWKAYQDYQASQRASAPAGAAGAPSATPNPTPAALPAPHFEALPAPQLEQHSQAMLMAVIAAAKSDGHMDDRERELVQAELQRLDADSATRRWVEDELRRPIDPAAVAAQARTPELAAEVYLASVLVVDDTTAMERAYLDALARELNLAPGLKADLEAKARAA
jgi:uncharacterized membrane protein YebE (DUF533 family)